MEGAALYPNASLRLPSFSTSTTRPMFARVSFSLKDSALTSRIRTDINNDRPRKKGGSKPSLSSEKDHILALFKRIQTSMSKGGEPIVKKKDTMVGGDIKPLAEDLLELLDQSIARGKVNSTSGEKEHKFPAPQKDSLKEEKKYSLEEEKETENSSPPVVAARSARPASAFTRRSPIPIVSVTRDEPQLKTGIPSWISNPPEEAEQRNGPLHDEDDQPSNNLEEMKLSDLKEVAKSKGIKGYSKLKKSELVKLLMES